MTNERCEIYKYFIEIGRRDGEWVAFDFPNNDYDYVLDKVKRLRQEYPKVSFRLVVCTETRVVDSEEIYVD